jgi:hypothetical protein
MKMIDEDDSDLHIRMKNIRNTENLLRGENGTPTEHP